MKPTASLPPARQFAPTAGSAALRQYLCWTLAGLGLGVGAVSAYLLLGNEYLWGIPRWAAFVFYPGFAAGVQANQWGLRVGPSPVVGVLAVCLAYATVVALARFLWFALKYCRQSAALRKHSE